MALHAFETSWRTGRTVDGAIVYGAGDAGAVGGCVVRR
jgi:hypothetical protein